jgi:PAS domain S-box-containing protein
MPDNKLTPPANAVDGGKFEFKEIADNAPVMIWRAGTGRMRDWFNKPWLDYSGRQLAALQGYGWATDVHPDDLERCMEIYETSFDARATFEMSYRLRNAEGAYCWFLDNGAPFYRDGEFIGYLGSCIDITRHRALEEHQRVLLAELNHRVNNNLQLIIAFLQLSRKHAQGDEAKSLLQDAISRIYGVGVAHAQLHKHLSGQVDLGEYLPELARAVLNAQKGDDALLSAASESVHVPFKLASNLGLIVNELITNSVKHGGAESGVIELNVSMRDSATLEIAVQDHGLGFSPELLANSDPAARRRSLIEALLQSCQASMARQNRNGALVTVTVPVAPEASAAHDN